MKRLPILCPSYSCSPDASLIGIIDEDGRVAFLGDDLEVSAEFIEIARQGRAPGRRFRFCGTCAEDDCEQWTGRRCGVIDRVIELAQSTHTVSPTRDSLPSCGIRPQCRWFKQKGVNACRVCPLVITETRS